MSRTFYACEKGSQRVEPLAKDPFTVQLLSAEIERVKGEYRVNIMRENIDRWTLICKPHKNCNGGFEEPIGFNAQNVLDHLAPDKRWDERARAACLLRNIKTAAGKDQLNKGEPFEKLVKHMGPEENSLCVAKMALETYKDLTGFQSKGDGIFDFDEAIADWKIRQTEILRLNL